MFIFTSLNTYTIQEKYPLQGEVAKYAYDNGSKVSYITSLACLIFKLTDVTHAHVQAHTHACRVFLLYIFISFAEANYISLVLVKILSYPTFFKK